MGKKDINLNEAIKFHGHLGPYLVLGVLAGEFALKRLRARKYFGLKVLVYGANSKPKSCLIDGLQLSTGATFGKGNIRKLNGRGIKVLFSSLDSHKKIGISLKKDLVNRLNGLKGHHDSEVWAKRLYRINPLKIFNLSIT